MEVERWGETIRKLREGRGWTQYELAKRAGVTVQSISRWELAQTKPRLGQSGGYCRGLWTRLRR